MDERLTIDEIRAVVEAVSDVFVREYAGEPIPPFDTHDPGKLDGALAAPFQSAFGEDIYPTVYDKAAALFYFMAKDHPFDNGNKRTAVMTLLYYLAKNGLAIEASSHELYEIAVGMVEARSNTAELISRLGKILAKYCIPFDEWVKKSQ